MAETKKQLVGKVEEGEQAIVLVLLAKNEDGGALLDSQLNLALYMAKNVVQQTGAEVSASGSVFAFDATTATARITATLEELATSVDESTESDDETTIDDEGDGNA